MNTTHIITTFTNNSLVKYSADDAAMTNTYIITTVTFEKLKQKAKKLKKETNISHHEALDIIANNYGKILPKNMHQSIFIWKHIADAHRITKIAEDAISDGFVVLIDSKNDPLCDMKLFIRDMQLKYLCQDLIKELYLQHTDLEEDGISCTQEERLEWFNDDYRTFGFFRLKGDIPSSKKEAWELYFKEFFSGPEASIFQGKAFDSSVGYD